MAKLGKPVDVAPDHLRDYRAAWERIKVYSTGVGDHGRRKGIIRFQVADGYAVYVVERLDPTPVLRHVPFGDAYTVHPALIRGLTKAEIIGMLDREAALRALFAK